ncbi:MAG: orotate phosphoribosyltransferase [Legionella sp.]|nr:orotate phosphoribosyltransferase [Legionella sp.]
MNSEKKAFIQMILEADVLRWGEFTLKSGRISPYFFNAGLFYQGDVLRRLGGFYANTLIKNKPNARHLFGPAYKGLPLGTATAIACAEQGINMNVSFNRKEIKTHGEGGQLIGAPLDGKKVVMIDDVITAGTAFRESKALITEAGGILDTVLIALDREERGPNNISAIAEIKSQGIDVFSIITLSDLMEYLESHSEIKQLERMKNYQDIYGA